MASTIAQSPFLQAVSSLEIAELGGASRKSWITNNVSPRVSASAGSSSASGHGLQSLRGLRRAGVVDALTSRSGRDLQGSACPSAASRAFPGMTVVAEVRDKTTELKVNPAQEETGLFNGRENSRSPDFESIKSVSTVPILSKDDHARSRSFNSGTDSYRPAARRSVETATGSSFRPAATPSSSATKQKGRGLYSDKFVPPGSKLHHVNHILETLENSKATDEGVKAAMDGWSTSINPRDIVSVMAKLDWKKAQAFFNWLKSQGYELNLVVYNVLLGRFRAGRVWNMAENFAVQMIEDGIRLDNYTYSTLISCALRCNLCMEALKWFDKMHENGCVPDEVTYSNMALVYSRLGRFDDAMQLYESLRETGWKPDKISFGTMVNVYSRGGKYFKASAVIREMLEAGLVPEAVVYNTLIRYFAREGKTAQAKRVFGDMETAGVKPTAYTLCLMIEVHGRVGETQEAFQLFTRMKEEKLPLDVVVYNSMLKMCAEERLVGEAENLFAEMVGRDFNPDAVTYKSMINLYAKEGRVNDAEKFAYRMVEAGHTRDVAVFSCLIKACGVSKDYKRAAVFLEQMLADGCRVDDKCCGVLLSLMNSCETTEDRTVVVDCLRTAKPALSRIVDVLLADNLDLDAIEELLHSLLSESDEKSVRPFCNALIDLCWNLDKKYLAQKLLTLADSLGVYTGGLRTKTATIWFLHLRSLSFNAGECALAAWIQYLRDKAEEGEEFPKDLVIETGVGRHRGDTARLFSVILSKLKDIGAPFEPTPERTDWIVSTGSAIKDWLRPARASG